MTQWSFPFVSVAGDRKYQPSDWVQYYANLFRNGILPQIGTGLQVKAMDPASMNVTVSAGAAIINGYQYSNTENYTQAIAVASATVDRVDGIFLQLDLPSRLVEIIYKEGNVTPQRDTNIHELLLATITVAKNSVVVTNASITDKRSDTNVCGYSTPFATLNLSSLQDQYETMLSEAFTLVQTDMNADAATLQTLLTNQEALFTTWFQGLQDTLTTNVEANLQAQINALDADTLLATITHNLNQYPHVRALAWDYGIGLTGLGNEPAGLFGGSNVKTVPCSTEYTSKQALKVSIPVGYAMVTPVITQLNAREWLLTSGTKSLQITLMEV